MNKNISHATKSVSFMSSTRNAYLIYFANFKKDSEQL